MYIGIGWLAVTCLEPVYLTFVQIFSSNMRYAISGPITTTVRGVRIDLDQEAIYHILNVVIVGLRIYETKA